jgi:hypothetical protein
MILIEAPSSAYRGGTAGVGLTLAQEEETSGGSTPRRTSFMVASTCTPVPWSLCILSQEGQICLHRHMKAAGARSGPNVPCSALLGGLRDNTAGCLARQNAIQHTPALVRQCRSSSFEAWPPWLCGIFQNRGH